MEEKNNIIAWTEEHNAMIILFNPRFPIKVTKNVMYSFFDYAATVGGQYGAIIAIIAAFS